MSIKSTLSIGLLSLVVATGTALAAQKPAANAGQPGSATQTASEAKPVKHARHVVHHPRSQISLQCSEEANAKGLHGKERQSFRHSCMKGHMASGTGSSTPAPTGNAAKQKKSS